MAWKLSRVSTLPLSPVRPLTARLSKSRFCDGRAYAVLYAAGDFATAFAEVVVRDRLVTGYTTVSRVHGRTWPSRRGSESSVPDRFGRQCQNSIDGSAAYSTGCAGTTRRSHPTEETDRRAR
jgi:hypothetical protein